MRRTTGWIGWLCVVLWLLAGSALAQGGGGGGDDGDADGLTDAEELLLGTRPDVADTDGDGIIDGIEVGRAGDLDPITRTDPRRADTDGDGLADGAEDRNRNGRLDDGESDPTSADSDGGGTDDGRESGDGTDPRDPADDFDTADPDMDGLSTRLEARLGTDPADPDTDNDGLDDGEEDANRNGRVDRDESHPLRIDTDGGGTSDGNERVFGSDPLDPFDDPEADPDGDGLSTRVEAELGTDGRNPDSDRDGLDDGVEAAGPTDPTDADTDDDGLDDGDEIERGTDPLRSDSDGGGTRDGQEVLDGTDPNDAADDLARDDDGDGLDARLEARYLLDPFDADTDDDGVPDGEERSPSADSDGDGLPNGRDADSDDDGITDGVEMGYTEPHADTDEGRGLFRADADPSTLTDPLRADTDQGGADDGEEDLDRNGRIDAGETDPNDPGDDGTPPVDSDGDGLEDDLEREIGLDPGDADSDDDGLLDGEEPSPRADTDGDMLIDALDPDADGDGLTDGLEAGVDRRHPDSDPAVFVPDDDPTTTTDPRRADTDGGGVDDGDEDVNGNGVREPAETDPRDPSDDRPPMMEDADVDADPVDMQLDGSQADSGPPAEQPAPEIDDLYGGCEVSGSGGAGWLLIGLLLLGLGRRGAAAAMLLLAVLTPQGASAIEADRFAPAIGDGIVEVERAAVDGHLELRTGLWIRFAGATMAGAYADGSDTGPLSGAATRLDATVALALADRIELGVGVPAVLTREGMARDGSAIDGGGLGDLRVLAKVMAWRSADRGLALGLALPMHLPTGEPDRWLGADGVRLTPTAIFDVDLEPMKVAPVSLSLALGYRVAPDEALYGSAFGDALHTAVAARYAVPDQPLAVAVSVAGEIGLAGDVQAATTPYEAHGLIEWAFAECLVARAGAGAALTGAVGAAPARLLLGIARRCPQAVEAPPVAVVKVEPPPAARDTDADGIFDDVDRCPQDPEDKDDHDDLDGCPDPDNDGDGINDVEDPCPDDPEDRDGFEDVDGCPEADNDRDGFADNVDQCPNRPESHNGVRDDDGCPEETIASLGRVELSGGWIFLSEKLKFEGGSTLAPASTALIGELAGLLKRRDDLKVVEIGGHTSSEGSEAENIALSTRRAEAVRAALTAAGIDGGRLQAKGYGEALPIESNRTAAGRAANARIEFRVLDPAPE